MERRKSCFVIFCLVLACFLSITSIQGNIGRKVENTLGNANVKSSAASITVTSPTSGDIWKAGNSYDITWSSSGVGSIVDIELCYANGTITQFNIGNHSNTNNGLYTWTIPSGAGGYLGVPSGEYEIYIEGWNSSAAIYGYSSIFNISDSYILYVSYEEYSNGSYGITWTSSTWVSSTSSDIPYIDVYLATQDCTDYLLIASNVPNTGQYGYYDQYTVTSRYVLAIPSTVPAGNYTVKIVDSSDSSVYCCSSKILQVTRSSTPGFPVEVTLLGLGIGIFGMVVIVSRKRHLDV